MTQTPPPRSSSPDFIGRTRELAELRASFVDASSGRGRLVMISGEPGIGKTRLAEEIGREAWDKGAAVAWGHAVDEESSPPFWPWVEIVHVLAQQFSAEDAGLPAVLDALGGASDVSDASGPAVKERVERFDRVTAWLSGKADLRPIVLILDDLHATDEASLHLLRWVAQRVRNVPMLVVGTTRTVEARLHPTLANLHGDLSRAGTGVSLDGLSTDDVEKFVLHRTGRAPFPGLVAALERATGGNPFFLGEVVRQLQVAGSIHRGDQSTGFIVPNTVADVMRRTIEQLPEQTARTLRVASVVGREFDADLVTSLIGSEVDVLHELDHAVNRDLVTSINTIGRYRFSTGLIRDALYDSLPTAERMRTHRRVAEAIEQMPASRSAALVSELAHHWFKAAQAGEPGKAIEYAARAGARAETIAAYTDATRFYNRGLLVAQNAGDDGSAQRFAQMLGRIEGMDPEAATPISARERDTRSFRREGEYWSVIFDDVTTRHKDSKGIRFLVRLLEHPGREIHALDLAGALPGVEAGPSSKISDQELPRRDLGDAGPLMDETARSQYRARVDELRADIAEGREFNDPERVERAQTELDFIGEHLSAGVGLGGRDRVAASAAERARVNVTRAIRTTIERLSESNAVLAHHLERSVRTGIFCSYSPDPTDRPWILDD